MTRRGGGGIALRSFGAAAAACACSPAGSRSGSGGGAAGAAAGRLALLPLLGPGAGRAAGGLSCGGAEFCCCCCCSSPGAAAVLWPPARAVTGLLGAAWAGGCDASTGFWCTCATVSAGWCSLSVACCCPLSACSAPTWPLLSHPGSCGAGALLGMRSAEAVGASALGASLLPFAAAGLLPDLAPARPVPGSVPAAGTGGSACPWLPTLSPADSGVLRRTSLSLPCACAGLLGSVTFCSGGVTEAACPASLSCEPALPS